MKVSRILKKVILLSLFATALLTFNKENYGLAFTNQVIQQGATGEDVVELQARLQYIGFYNGKIDGVFGWGTYWALRNFQYEFGLPIDGLAGQDTKVKLTKASKYYKEFVHENINKGYKFTHYGGKSLDSQVDKMKKSSPVPKKQTAKQTKQTKQTKQAQPKKEEAKKQTKDGTVSPTAMNVPGGFSQNDIQLMANAVYGEARGEPYVGQVAVAAVILNRTKSASFPNTVSGVIFEPGAFTAVADGQIWLTPDEKAKKAVIDAINGWDPTGHALYYFNPDTATSSWIWSRPQIKKIGKHIYCK